MSSNVKPIPDGFHNVNVHLIVPDGNAAIDFYKQAFGAEEVCRIPGPGGMLMHGEVRIGDSTIMIATHNPQMQGMGTPESLGGATASINLYTTDADALYNRAVKAGATPLMPVQDMFWGDRFGMVTDPFGHKWEIATHVKDLTPEEVAEAAAKAFGDGNCGG